MQSDASRTTIELSQAREALARGDIQQADAICLQLLTQNPDHAAVLHLGSMLLYRQGEMVGAIERMMRAIELEPGRAEWLNDLGNLLAAHQQPDQAAKFFQHALMLTPENAVIWNNLGAMRVKLGQTELAGEAFEHAVALDETLVDAWANYANWLTGQGREQDAAECVLRAFVAAPSDGQPLLMRGMALARLGRNTEAADCFQQHLQQHPSDPTAQHLFHACAGDAVPERASDAYIRTKYDDYAENYEAHQAEMAYRGHLLVATAVDTCCGQELDVLDAGCGTGLVASGIARHCRSLTGVDLSEKMLLQARGLYQTLEQGEITSYMAAHPASFDLITAADLLIYFGALQRFNQQAFDCLRPGGHLIATIEAPQDLPDGFQLLANGRYRHGEHYVAQSLSAAGFDRIDIRPDHLRTEGGEQVACWLVTAHKPA
jgi:predicted TPR repeat methyltransferase